MSTLTAENFCIKAELEVKDNFAPSSLCRALSSYYVEVKPEEVLDGCSSTKDLIQVIKRTCIATSAFGIASSFFLATVIAGFSIKLFYVGPLGFTIMHVMSIINFVAIMLPFSMLLSWIYRYKHEKPYQRALLDVHLPQEQAFHICLASLSGVLIEKILEADQETGHIRAIGSRSANSGAQDITMQIQTVNSQVSRVRVDSRPSLNAIEALLFGYTLSVDRGKNKRNTDQIIQFIRSAASVSPVRPEPLKEQASQELISQNARCDEPLTNLPI